MSIRRVTGSVAQIHNVMVNAPHDSPWPMCRTCRDILEEVTLVDDPEPRPGKNPIVIRVRGRCHGAEETVSFDMLSEETLAQDPEALSKLVARWRWFDEALGHVGN